MADPLLMLGWRPRRARTAGQRPPSEGHELEAIGAPLRMDHVPRLFGPRLSCGPPSRPDTNRSARVRRHGRPVAPRPSANSPSAKPATRGASEASCSSLWRRRQSRIVRGSLVVFPESACTSITDGAGSRTSSSERWSRLEFRQPNDPTHLARRIRPPSPRSGAARACSAQSEIATTSCKDQSKGPATAVAGLLFSRQRLTLPPRQKTASRQLPPKRPKGGYL
jgi:hypothetical protein